MILKDGKKKADLCLALGTSLSGLNADRIAKTVANKYPDRSFGLVIVAIQATQLDNICTLRIFAKLNNVMSLLAEELELTEAPQPQPLDGDIFTIPYHEDTGMFAEGRRTTLNLTVGSRIKVTKGNYAGCVGVVDGKNPQGHYKLKIQVPIKEIEGVEITYDHLLGSWWIDEAMRGLIPVIPVVNE